MGIIKDKPRKDEEKSLVNENIMRYVYGLLMITLSVIGLLKIGFLGRFVTGLIIYLFGNLYGIVYLFVMAIALCYLFNQNFKGLDFQYRVGAVILLVVWIVFASLPSDEKLSGWSIAASYLSQDYTILNIPTNVGGGFVGSILASILTWLFAITGTKLILFTLFVVAVIFIGYGDVYEWLKKATHMLILYLRKYINELREVPEEETDDLIEHDASTPDIPEIEEVVPLQVDKGSQLFVDFENDFNHQENGEATSSEETSPKKKSQEMIEKIIGIKDTFISSFDIDYANYKLPKLSLLNETLNKKGGTNQKAATEAGTKLIEILEEFGVKATLLATHIGPTVTKFEIKPDLGVRVNKISSLQYDIKMALAAKDIRIEAPIPGKSAVGIEIPNVEKTFVSMKDMMRSIPEKYNDSKLLFSLGKDLSGTNIYGELNKMPHLLIAGATGSGKSVCVNAIITSLLMRVRPDEVKLLLIDPKKVEFTPYRNLPHLLAPIVSNEEEANRALKMIVAMMDQRYDLFAKAGVRNLDSYNEYVKSHADVELEVLPYVVVIIDELADLMMVAAKDVEASIQRITQLARAAGIHLIVATQRPSVDVITGVIKSNIQSRIAFSVASVVDSKTILDKGGAEKLLGNGDMLYLPTGENNPIRVQGVFINDDEIEAVCKFVCSQGKAKYDDNFVNLKPVENINQLLNENNDPLYEEVKTFVIETRKASTSLIQRKFSIGYARAARLMDTLELNGIIGESRGSRPREVLVPLEENDVNDFM